MASLLCRALSESEPQAKLKLSANQSGTLNESKRKRSTSLVRGTSRVLSESEPQAKLKLSANQSQRKYKGVKR